MRDARRSGFRCHCVDQLRRKRSGRCEHAEAGHRCCAGELIVIGGDFVYADPYRRCEMNRIVGAQWRMRARGKQITPRHIHQGDRIENLGDRIRREDARMPTGRTVQFGMQQPRGHETPSSTSQLPQQRGGLRLIDKQFHGRRGVQVHGAHQGPRVSSIKSRAVAEVTPRWIVTSASTPVRAGRVSPRAIRPSNPLPPTGLMMAAGRPLLLTMIDSPPSTRRKISPLRLRISRCVICSIEQT
ncbi:MAG: hypothetical protein RI885_1557 [Actinomycetota bacterium]